MTRDEFGMALFDTVKLCTGIEQLRRYKNLPPARIKPGQLTDWARERDLIATLAQAFPQLTPEEQAQILDHFPWVAQC
jgi:hypothetical protein